MKAYAPSGAILLFVFTALSSGFEPFDYKTVPFPNSGEDYEFQLMSMVETLTDIASIEELPDDKRARILAAARRISPLNRRAFFTEYELSLGQKPSGGAPIRKEMISSFLQPHLARLTTIPGTEEYVAFLTEAMDFDAEPRPATAASGNEVDFKLEKMIPVAPMSSPDPFSDEPAAPVKTIAGDNACGILTLKGCAMLGSNNAMISGSSFQFSPGNLKSKNFLSAYREALKFLALARIDGLSGRRLNFLIDAELTDEEGPSAALACAVMTEALAENFRLDPSVAFSGDVNADGSVQPLHDQKDRLESSPEALFKIIVIPQADRSDADDILLLHGPWMFSETQLIGVKTLGESIKVARQEKDPEVKEALAIFSEVQDVLNKAGGRSFLTNGHVRKRLDRVLELMPNHISAQQLSDASKGRYPATLSLNGSFDLIYAALKPAMNDGEIDSSAKLEPKSMEQLKLHRTRIDPTLKNLVDATFSFENSGRLGSDSGNERTRVKQRLKEELSAISRNVKIRERMM